MIGLCDENPFSSSVSYHFFFFFGNSYNRKHAANVFIYSQEILYTLIEIQKKIDFDRCVAQGPLDVKSTHEQN